MKKYGEIQSIHQYIDRIMNDIGRLNHSKDVPVKVRDETLHVSTQLMVLGRFVVLCRYLTTHFSIKKA